MRYAGRTDVVVLGLPRGGVPVAYEVASLLGAPLDAFSVRKLGVPGREELAMGAITASGVRVLNDDVLDSLGIPLAELERVAGHERDEAARRERAYRGDRAPLALAGTCAIVVDDGVATGASMLVAVRALRAYDPKQIVVAVPVAPAETCALLSRYADEVVACRTPEPFGGVGSWYHDFSQTSEDEVRALLGARAARYVG